MSNKIALVSLDFAGTGSMCGGNKGVGGDGCAISRNNNQDLPDRNSQPARQGRGNRTRSGRLRWRRVSREGPRSRTRHGATSVRGNNLAECREPDQPDRSTKLRIHFLGLLPAGACASRGVAVVAAMMPHVPKGGFYEAFRYSTTDSVFGFATDRPYRASASQPQRQRRKEGGRQALGGKSRARASRQGRYAGMAARRRQQALFISDYQGRPESDRGRRDRRGAEQ